jgi:hypothetical protein
MSEPLGTGMEEPENRNGAYRWMVGEVAMDEDCLLLTGRDVQDEDLLAHDEEGPR